MLELEKKKTKSGVMLRTLQIFQMCIVIIYKPKNVFHPEEVINRSPAKVSGNQQDTVKIELPGNTKLRPGL